MPCLLGFRPTGGFPSCDTSHILPPESERRSLEKHPLSFMYRNEQNLLPTSYPMFLLLKVFFSASQMAQRGKTHGAKPDSPSLNQGSLMVEADNWVCQLVLWPSSVYTVAGMPFSPHPQSNKTSTNICLFIYSSCYFHHSFFPLNRDRGFRVEGAFLDGATWSKPPGGWIAVSPASSFILPLRIRERYPDHIGLRYNHSLTFEKTCWVENRFSDNG